ncbi:hypothetical protein B1H26_12775 [Amycolatopsis sp. BJA-103]|nr:hypothetical protein BKN51_35085 [Amycolatopsis sp. BJA-103]PNE18707.1 hypothetical protein B1H26_12775 [Amycolatopsis sp. BJA-103]
MICWTSVSGRNGQAAVILAGEAGGGGVVGVVLVALLADVDGGAGGGAGAGSPLQAVRKRSVPTDKSPQVLLIGEM